MVTGVAVRLNIEANVAVGTIGVALLNATLLGETLTNLIVAWTSLETALGSVARTVVFKRETRLKATDSPGVSRLAPASDWPRASAIEFRNVWASY